MAKILFIQKEPVEKFGTMILSSVLKRVGHSVDLFIELLEKRAVLDYLKEFKPDYVAFSITTVESDWALKLAKKIKKKNKRIMTIFGGAEPTHSPYLIKNKYVDIICRGEGENAFLQVIKRLNKGKSLRGIKNIWYKKGNKIFKNELDRLIDNLDELPLPDREIYYKYKLLRNLSTKKFLCSRGCPYNCTYCSNHAYRSLFFGLGQFIRFRNPRHVIDEIKRIKEKFGMKRVYFADETFTLNHDWLNKLLSLYRKEIKLPFSCLARVNEMDEKTIKELKKSGCFYIAFGLETGSEQIRNGILKRNMADKDLLRISRLLKKYKIPFLTHEMFVLPTETLEDALKTVQMNIKMGTDSVWGTVFQPFPNTEIYDYCLKNKLMRKGKKIDSTYGESVIKNKDKKEIQKLRKIDWLIIKCPFLLPLARKAVFLPDNIFFDLSLRMSEVYSIRKRWQLSILEMLQLARGTGKLLG